MTEPLLKDKVALVTGGARGIGRACVNALSRSGAAVVILDRLAQEAEIAQRDIVGAGGYAAVVLGDVTNTPEIPAMVGKAEAAFGGLDILVNNAGISLETPTEQIGPEQWDRVMDVNVKAVFFLIQAVLPALRRRGGGAIVNISSIVARSGGVNSTVDYTASKSAVLGMTRALARQYGPEGIRVNAVTPGPVMTEMIQHWPKAKLEDLVMRSPLRRLGSPEDVANAVVFLASPWAGWLTGVGLDVTGGIYMG